MCLAAAVLNDCRASDIQVCLVWLIVPLVRVLSFCEFLDKLVKRRVPVTNACAIAKYCIETGGLTIIQQSELLVALKSACAYGQT